MMKKVCSVIKLMRPHHYIKNGLLFLPLVFSGNLFNKECIFIMLIGFLAFSLSSSMIYIINDIFDVEKDRLHPKKCKRPIASGEISIKFAWFWAFLLFIAVILLNSIVATNNIGAWVLLGLYIVLNFSYSMGLKQVPLIDVAILVSGFLIRVLYGASIINVVVSNWLYLTVISMAFYLGLGKRRNEMSRQGSETRKVLQFYNYNFLDKNMYLANALTIVFYSLWCVDTSTVARFSNKLIWTVPLVMLISMKYSLNIEGNSDGDPVDVVLGDKLLMGLAIIYMISILILTY